MGKRKEATRNHILLGVHQSFPPDNAQNFELHQIFLSSLMQITTLLPSINAPFIFVL